MVFQHFSLFELSVREKFILGIDETMSYSNLEKKLENTIQIQSSIRFGCANYFIISWRKNNELKL